MTAENGAIGKIVGVIYRSRSQSGGQDKAVVDVDRGMLFQTVMRLVVFYNPVRVQIAVEYKRDESLSSLPSLIVSPWDSN